MAANNSYFLKNTNTPPNLQIFENDIGSPDDLDGQPRIGILLSHLDKIKVSGNKIRFNHASTPTEPHIGIWVENCLKTKIIDENVIQNISNFQFGSSGIQLIGLQLNQSAMSCIEENDFLMLLQLKRKFELILKFVE